MFGEETLVPLGLFAMIAFVIVGVTKIVSEGRIRRRLIETNATPEFARAIVATPQGDAGLYAALKWGILTGAVGLALVVIQFLPYRADDPIVAGVILVFAAVALLQQRRLRIAQALPEAATLVQELQNYRLKIDPQTAHDAYSAWREGQHDDVLFAVALACWWAGQAPRRFGAAVGGQRGLGSGAGPGVLAERPIVPLRPAACDAPGPPDPGWR